MSDMRKEMQEARREGTKWWMWGLGLFILSVVALTSLSYFGVFTDTVVERKVFEESFQYNEARESEIATYTAQIAEIDSKLSDPNLDDATRRNLEAQKSAIEVRLNTAKSKQ